MPVSGNDIDESVFARQSSTDELIDIWLTLLEVSTEDRFTVGSQGARLQRFSTAIAKPGLIDQIVQTAPARAPCVADH